ncbi:MAG: hypothetical protein JRH11_14295, partial [Deltaproteobacteria bacterium]|nr:hypothetical protein [Deltaproteobacteria bacterium]
MICAGLALLPAMAVVLSGCSGEPPAETCEPRDDYRWSLLGPPTLSLLFVIDDSESMAEEQAAFAAGLPPMLRALTSGDLDGDGGHDFSPIVSLRVGVISTDMGTAGFEHPTCNASDLGDDGLLLTAGDPSIAGCREAYQSFLSYQSYEVVDVDALGADLSCKARIGT